MTGYTFIISYHLISRITLAAYVYREGGGRTCTGIRFDPASALHSSQTQSANGTILFSTPRQCLPSPSRVAMRATYGTFVHPMNAMSRCFDWAARSFDGSLLDGWMDVEDTRRTHSGKRDGELGRRGPFATVFNLFRCVYVWDDRSIVSVWIEWNVSENRIYVNSFYMIERYKLI